MTSTPLAPHDAARLLYAAAVRAGTLRTLFDEDQPRDEQGQWTSGGGSFTFKGKVAWHPSGENQPELVSEDVGKKLFEIGQAISDEGDQTVVAVQGTDNLYNVTIRNPNRDRELTFEISKGSRMNQSYLGMVEFNEATTPRQARAALARTMDVMDMEDVDEITVDASLSDGGYLWARLGFQADNPAGFREMVHNRVQSIDKNYQTSRLMHDEYTREELDGLLLAINTNNARADLPQILADTPGGKSFLRGTSWSGILKLREPGATDRINHFLGRRKKAA